VIGPVGVGVEVGNVVDEVGKVVGVVDNVGKVVGMVDDAGVCISPAQVKVYKTAVQTN
jgi:hypothetical protein